MLRGELEARLHEELFHERVADLDGRAHLFEAGIGVGTAGEAAGAVDTVAARVGADEKEDAAGALRFSALELGSLGDTDAHGVDERVAGEGRREEDLAAHVGDAEAVAVAADAADDAVEEVAVAGVVGRAEAERVEDGDGVGAHGEDVADDAADAGCGALVGLDGGRMVVGFDLHDDAAAAADVDGAGVFGADAGEHAVAAAREEAEQRLAVLVAAVLAPEGAEHAEFDLVGFAAEALDKEVVLVVAEGDGVEGGLCGWHVASVAGMRSSVASRQSSDGKQRTGAGSEVGCGLGQLSEARSVQPCPDVTRPDFRGHSGVSDWSPRVTGFANSKRCCPH